MRANQPKRKVFNDAIDLLTGTEPEGGVQMLPIDAIAPFHEHPFKLYEGERLNDMVESIREHGILTPVIVQKTASGYVMLAGHNRQNAAKLARLTFRHIGDTENYSLLEVNLLTGRHHQIRCQLAGIGCCLKGDLKYGAPRSNRDGGISLMARHISFIHPVSKLPIEITAPVPEDWKGLSLQ